MERQSRELKLPGLDGGNWDKLKDLKRLTSLAPAAFAWVGVLVCFGRVEGHWGGLAAILAVEATSSDGKKRRKNEKSPRDGISSHRKEPKTPRKTICHASGPPKGGIRTNVTRQTV